MVLLFRTAMLNWLCCPFEMVEIWVDLEVATRWEDIEDRGKKTTAYVRPVK